MRLTSLLGAVALIVPLVGTAAMAEAPAQAGGLTLERVFGTPALGGTPVRAQKLSPDGKLLTSLRARADEKERFDLWALDLSTGQERMLVDSKRLGSGAELSEAEKMQRERRRIGGSTGIVSYQWSADGQTILVPLEGDLYLATRDGRVRQLTKSEAGELNPVVSPRGSHVSFVRDRNLFTFDLAKNEERQVTRGGGGTIGFGEAEFVAQEEMNRYTGYWWSPDDKRIAVEKFDEAPVGIVSRAAIGADGTKVYDQRYPAAGTPNALVELYIVSPKGGTPVKVDLGTEADIYLARVDWTADGSALLVQRESRDQKRLDMLRVDPETGASTVLFGEVAGARSWINLSDNLRALKDGSLIWWSERDGHGHLYRWANGKWTQLTSGAWEVRDVIAVDEAKGRLLFTANKDTPIEQHVYEIDLAKPGTPRRLTEAGFWNAAEMDKSGTRMLVNRSGPDQPAQTYLADAQGNRLRWLDRNAIAGDHPYAPYLAQHVTPEFGTLKAKDGSTLHYKLLKPKGAEGTRHPVLVQVYNGPGAGRQVMKQWGNPLHQYLVSRGWVIFSIDGRGSPDRGTAFENQIYHAMGTVEVDDQLTGVAWLKQQPFVDPEKVAVYGWSYGGYMTLKLLEAAPGTFAAGVSGAPVTRWGLYDTHYTERYLGDPNKDPQSYSGSDALGNADKIADPLLLIHGMADDNVVFEHSTALMAKLQKAGHPFETMVYPGQTHSVGGPGVSVHLWKTIEAFLDRSVGKGE
ncbi:dipeptidyl-peptidase-4 [Sphingomonas zeicaulis]|uniref:S9 family peptidase n=1 Tax=Sphingomonas zeicaulis TaxID=1632740 RepID=UPI003D25D7DE